MWLMKRGDEKYCDDQVDFLRGDHEIAPSSPVSYTHGFVLDSQPYKIYISAAKWPPPPLPKSLTLKMAIAVFARTLENILCNIFLLKV
jgi:hypothetical protein